MTINIKYLTETYLNLNFVSMLYMIYFHFMVENHYPRTATECNDKFLSSNSKCQILKLKISDPTGSRNFKTFEVEVYPELSKAVRFQIPLLYLQ